MKKETLKAKEQNYHLLKAREQIQEDLICLLDEQFGLVEYVDEVKDMACQVVVDNFKQLLKKTK